MGGSAVPGYDAAMQRTRVSTGTPWEATVGYSRLVRAGDQIHVTGTTATTPEGGFAGEGDAYVQSRQILANIARALAQVGAGLEDVVRTRIFVTDIRRDFEAVGRAHREALGHVRPATTMVEVSRLVDDRMLVEIEADAVATPAPADRADEGIGAMGINEAPAVAALLRDAGLPVPAEGDVPVPMLVTRAGGGVIACAGHERYGNAALVRSVAVHRDHQGRGVGQTLIAALLDRLRRAGVAEAWLLTLSADPFFRTLGFSTAAREDVPAPVGSSVEFRIHCCDSARVMRKVLRPPGTP